ncbi:unnamed protein product [Rhizophagus irregularis]|nr:unnamed protein product [Rhizophagus irregularis]
MLLQTIPKSQYYTGWVQSHIGERHILKWLITLLAERFFQKGTSIRTVSFKDMEIFLLHLWHLLEQQEHDLALKMFPKSYTLDPKFTYAHTLSGHESMANGNFEKAQEHFRNALNTNKRHL